MTDITKVTIDPAVLQSIATALPVALLKRINSGEATASDFSVARQLLKDNGVQAVPVKNSPLGNLADSLPHFEDSQLPH